MTVGKTWHLFGFDLKLCPHMKSVRSSFNTLLYLLPSCLDGRHLLSHQVLRMGLQPFCFTRQVKQHSSDEVQRLHLEMLKCAAFARNSFLQEKQTYPGWGSPWECCSCPLALGTGCRCCSSQLPERCQDSADESGGTQRGEHAFHWPAWKDTDISHSQSFHAKCPAPGA